MAGEGRGGRWHLKLEPDNGERLQAAGPSGPYPDHHSKIIESKNRHALIFPESRGAPREACRAGQGGRAQRSVQSSPVQSRPALTACKGRSQQPAAAETRPEPAGDHHAHHQIQDLRSQEPSIPPAQSQKKTAPPLTTTTHDHIITQARTPKREKKKKETQCPSQHYHQLDPIGPIEGFP